MKSYLITDPKYYKDTKSFKEYLISIYKNKKPSFASFRDKINQDFDTFAEIFVKISKYFQIEKILINQNIQAALKFKAHGVHLTSSQFNQIEYAKKRGLYVIISTHSKEEALLAKKLGADAITFSPIFKTPNKGEPKGIEELKKVIKEIDIKCFALGGIVGEREIEICKKSGCYGFASIRYFIK